MKAPIALLLTACGLQGRITIESGDARALVAAVNNPEYSFIVLEPGTYTLTSQLVLRAGVRLHGEQKYVDNDGDGVWDADADGRYVASGETIIDVGGRSEALGIVMGAGSTLSGVTVRGAGRMAEGSDTFVLRFTVAVEKPTLDTPVTVENCVIEAGYHAVGVFTSEPGAYRMNVTASVLRDNVEGATFSAHDASGVTINAFVDHTRIESSLTDDTGIAATNNSATDCAIALTTANNIIEKQGSAGVFVAAGFTLGGVAGGDAKASSSNNTVTWSSTNDAIRNNGAPGLPTTIGGISLAGAFDLNLPLAPSEGNSVTATITAARFEGNAGADIFAIGGWAPLCGAIGSNNDVTLSVDGEANIVAANSFNETTAQNTVTAPGTVLPSLAPACL